MIKNFNFEEGEILLFDKPFDWSSFDLVKKIRYAIKKYAGKDIKVGHAGTLDPYATGLLILCTGKMTKKIEQIQGLEKEYTGTIKLGKTTPSYDLETEPDQEFPTEHITIDSISESMKSFIGINDQIPPVYSAKMINGKRAYELARKGETIEMKPNPITIYAFELKHYADNIVEFEVKCSKGTYIRSLANDLGKKLNSGAHLSSLKRTAIGHYKLENAMTIEEFIGSLNK